MAFCLSKKKNQETWQRLFKIILPDGMDTKIFMADMDDSYRNAWEAAVGNIDHRRSCEWHVHKRWTERLGAQKMGELREIQVMTDKSEFESAFNEWLVANPQHQKYMKYYTTTHPPKEWARCYIESPCGI